MTVASPDDTHLEEFRELIERSGYGEILACFDPCEVRPEVWQRVRRSLPSEEGAMLGLFLLSETVDIDALPKPISEGLQILVDVGLCAVTGHQVSMNEFALFNARGVWVFAHAPSIAPSLYFGDDSVALMNHVAPRMGGVALDLCCGPGAQALFCSHRSAHVVASDINPIAAALASVNVAFNGRQEQISVRCGDLYQTVVGEQFDTIVVNPPLLPIPPDLHYPFVGDGGSEGLDLVRRVLEGAPAHLAVNGTLHSLGATLSDGFLPTAYDDLKDTAARLELNVTMTITAHVPAGVGSRWSTGVGGTIAAISGYTHHETVDRLVAAYSAIGGSHVCAYFLTARAGEGHFFIRDLSDEVKGGFWYV